MVYKVHNILYIETNTYTSKYNIWTLVSKKHDAHGWSPSCGHHYVLVVLTSNVSVGVVGCDNTREPSFLILKKEKKNPNITLV